MSVVELYPKIVGLEMHDLYRSVDCMILELDFPALFIFVDLIIL